MKKLNSKRKRNRQRSRKRQIGKKGILVLVFLAAVAVLMVLRVVSVQRKDDFVLLKNEGALSLHEEYETPVLDIRKAEPEEEERLKAETLEKEELPAKPSEEKQTQENENLMESAEILENEEIDTIEETGEPETDSVKLSILGDSISTFDEWIPEGYQDFFPMSGEVTEVSQTWWKMLLDSTEMTLCVNGSSSGSTCVGDSGSADNPQYGCSDCRIKGLAKEDGTLPDVILVYMGTNDLVTSVPIGDNDGTKSVEEGMVETFSDAYTLILDKLASYYPEAKIFCCTLAPVGDWGTEQPFVTFVNGQGITYVEYCDTIRKIAGAKGYPVIDLQNCGITIDNMPQYITDGVHLKPEGMVLVKAAVQSALQGYY